jgi:hypothetical protein
MRDSDWDFCDIEIENDPPATDRQLKYLRDLGLRRDLDGMSSDEADALIKKYMNRPTNKQIMALVKYCGFSLENAKQVDRSKAKEIIAAEYERSGWVKR